MRSPPPSPSQSGDVHSCMMFVYLRPVGVRERCEERRECGEGVRARSNVRLLARMLARKHARTHAQARARVQREVRAVSNRVEMGGVIKGCREREWRERRGVLCTLSFNVNMRIYPMHICQPMVDPRAEVLAGLRRVVGILPGQSAVVHRPRYTHTLDTH
jgi:hypothetical protein